MDYPRAIVCVSGEGSGNEIEGGKSKLIGVRAASPSPSFPEPENQKIPLFLGKINKSMYADEVI